MAKRGTTNLLKSIVELPQARTVIWFDRLDTETQSLALQVREHIATHGGPVRPRARKMVEVLNLPVSAQTVATWLRSNE